MTYKIPKLKIHAHNYMRRWRHLGDYAKILLTYLIFVAIMSAAGIISFNALPSEPHYGDINTVPQTWYNVFMRWDGVHYANIATDGYGEYSYANYSFFPLFPMLIYAISWLTHVSPFITSTIISRLAFFASLFLMYNLFKSKFDKKIGFRTIIALVFFPASFFFIAPYTESIFLLLAVSTFLACRKQNWHIASICAMLAGNLKLLGCVLFPVVLIEYFRYYRRIKWNCLWMLIMPLGVVGYMIYLASTVGDPLYFSTCEADFQRFTALPFAPLWETITNFIPLLTTEPLLSILTFKNYFLEIYASIFSITLICIAFFKLDIKYSLYCTMLFIVPFSTKVDVQGLCGMARYCIVLFPLFHILARGFRNKWFAWSYCIIGTIINIYLMSRFATWYFVA